MGGVIQPVRDGEEQSGDGRRGGCRHTARLPDDGDPLPASAVAGSGKTLLPESGGPWRDRPVDGGVGQTQGFACGRRVFISGRAHSSIGRHDGGHQRKQRQSGSESEHHGCSKPLCDCVGPGGSPNYRGVPVPSQEVPGGSIRVEGTGEIERQHADPAGPDELQPEPCFEQGLCDTVAGHHLETTGRLDHRTDGGGGEIAG